MCCSAVKWLFKAFSFFTIFNQTFTVLHYTTLFVHHLIINFFYFLALENMIKPCILCWVCFETISMTGISGSFFSIFLFWPVFKLILSILIITTTTTVTAAACRRFFVQFYPTFFYIFHRYLTHTNLPSSSCGFNSSW